MFSQLQRTFFIFHTIVISFLCHKVDTINVTFVPKPIHITVKDLPAPFATPSADKDSTIIQVPSNPEILIPPGFTVKTFMINLNSPRYLLYTPSGDILVSEFKANRISCLVDNDNDGYPDERLTFADESNKLNLPYGMAFNQNYFYVANRDGIRRYPWTNSSRRISGEGEVIMNINPRGHWTRTIVVSPTADKIYVSIGSATNNDADPLPRASVQVANIDGSDQKTFASGLRNAVGLAFHPVTNELYVSCQERDGLGDDLVPDFFTRVQQDEFYGWPYAYMTPNLTDPKHRFPNGSSIAPDIVARTRTPDVIFQAHSGVLDMTFYTGKQFPNHYRQGAFAAFHGSWNKAIGTGFKIVFIPFNSDNRPIGHYEDFVDGFLVNASIPETFATPVGLLVLKDGSLLFTDDANNRIYQVQYNGAKTSAPYLCFFIILILFVCRNFVEI